MKEMLQRTILYGASLVLATGLGYVGFIYEASPDPLTLLGSADLSLRLAAGMPPTDRNGAELQVRRTQLERADALLAQVEELRPDSSFTREMQAYSLFLRGDWAGSSRLYRQAARLADADPERRQSILLNAAEMCREAGDGAGALAIVDDLGEVPGMRTRTGQLRALILLDGGDLAGARVALRNGLTPADGLPLEVMQCCEMLLQLGDSELAMTALDQLEDDGGGQIDYAVALLKLLSGRADSALATLEEVPESGCDYVGEALQRDRDKWKLFRSDDRLRRFFSSVGTSPAEPGQ
jgi:tetratricopeptide (TPR) repeat protein